MRKFSIAGIASLFVLVVFTACTSRAERTLSDMELLLDSLEALYAPDGRIELWSLSTVIDHRMLVLEGELASKAAYHAVSLAVNEKFPEVTVQVRLLPEHDQGRLVNGLVNNSVAHLRRNPSSKSELVSQALLGTPVRILKEEEGMFFIQVADGYLGWVNMNEVHFIEEEELSVYRDMEKLVYASQYGFAYSEPDENSLPVADLVLACTLPILDQKGAFYQVSYPDGRMAWVKKKEVLPAADIFNKVATGEEVIDAAMAFHGVPYLWGGASSKNLDCSGFVSNVFFMNGIQMPRDADQQSHCGRLITTRYEASELETGDLLFFGRKASPGEAERVSHVAIYKGEGEFIHASGFRDRVSINSMDSTQVNFIDTYPDIFVRACRIIGEEAEGFLPIVRNQYYKELIK